MYSSLDSMTHHSFTGHTSVSIVNNPTVEIPG